MNRHIRQRRAEEEIDDILEELDRVREEHIRRGKRALRRYHYRRLKKKRFTYWGGGTWNTLPPNPRHEGMKVSAPHPHSTCMCCCNQRIVEGPTRREREHELAFREELTRQETYPKG